MSNKHCIQRLKCLNNRRNQRIWRMWFLIRIIVIATIRIIISIRKYGTKYRRLIDLRARKWRLNRTGVTINSRKRRWVKLKLNGARFRNNLGKFAIGAQYFRKKI